MTPKLFTVIGFSALFSLSAIAVESAEPIPTVETAGLDFEQDAARKKKKKKQTRSNNGQGQKEKQAQDRADRKQREAKQAEGRAERAENQAERAQREANQAQRRANQAERQNGAQRGSSQGASSAQRRAQAERREEAARRAARHRNADRNTQRSNHSGHSNSHGSSHANRPHQGTAHKSRHARSHNRTHRWHSGWSQSHQRPVHWYHGVFVYGPNPYRHNRVRRGYYTDNSPVPMPSRKIDRDGAFSVGLTTGSYASGYDLGGEFSDFGLGVTTRFRPVEGLGFELAYSVHDETFDGDTQRTTTMLAPSVQVFAAPWSRISPYATVGVTFAERAYDDVWTDGFEEYTTQLNDSSFGPHVGIGLEFALGQNAAINFEARAIGYLDNQEGGTIPGAVQSTFGVQWYF
jgi:opacity protein-like surface antigen